MSKRDNSIWRWLVKDEYKLIGSKIYRLEDGNWTLAYTFKGPDADMRAYVQFRFLTKGEKP